MFLSFVLPINLLSFSILYSFQLQTIVVSIMQGLSIRFYVSWEICQRPNDMNHTYDFHQCIRLRRRSWLRTGGLHSPRVHGSSDDYDVHGGCSGDSRIDVRASLFCPVRSGSHPVLWTYRQSRTSRRWRSDSRSFRRTSALLEWHPSNRLAVAPTTEP